MIQENEIYKSHANGVAYRIISIGDLLETFSWEVKDGVFKKVKKVWDLRDGKLLAVEMEKGGSFKEFKKPAFEEAVANGTMKLIE